MKIKNKICTKCNQEKPIDDFGNAKKGACGKKSICKICEKKYREKNKGIIKKQRKGYQEKNKNKIKINQKNWYENNKEKVKEKSNLYYIENKDKQKEKRKEYYINNKDKIKEYRIKNKDKIIEKKKEYREINKDKIKANQKKYHNENKDKRNIQTKEYKNINRDKIKKYNKNWRESNKTKINNYNTKKLKTDPEFRLKHYTKKSFNQSLKRQMIKKEKSFFKYTGIAIKDYINHFKKSDLWNNFCNSKNIHIDHIIPISIYNFNIESEIKKCWNPRNLRLLPAEINLSKNNKIDYNLIKQYEIEDLLPNQLSS